MKSKKKNPNEMAQKCMYDGSNSSPFNEKKGKPKPPQKKSDSKM